MLYAAGVLKSYGSEKCAGNASFQWPCKMATPAVLFKKHACLARFIRLSANKILFGGTVTCQLIISHLISGHCACLVILIQWEVGGREVPERLQMCRIVSLSSKQCFQFFSFSMKLPRLGSYHRYHFGSNQSSNL